MSPELGHLALALAVGFAIAQAAAGLAGARANDARLMAAAPALALSHFLCLAVAFGTLIWASVTDDFSVRVLAETSSIAKPLLYKISGVWGNHEGSILLWCLILGGCGAMVSAFGGGLPTGLRARVCGVLGLVSGGFLLFALLTSNPFDRLSPAPVDGNDMNPLLQDPGLAIHPPMLYMGYVGFAVPFAFAVAALLEGRVDAAFGRWVRPWTLGAWALLTCGIALGSWWSYYVLGWGGYWFWDPVENASLLPWLTGTALLHSAIVTEKRGALKSWTVLLAIGTFSLSLAGTFLVRSGVLNSVHTFANDPARGAFILGLLAITIGGSLALYAWRAPAMAASGAFATVSRESALVLNNLFLVAAAAVVLTGTLYPIVAELALGSKLSVGAPFFNMTVLPLMAPVLLFMVAGPLMPWRRASLAKAFRQLWPALLLGAVVALVAGAGFKAGLGALAFAAGAYVVIGAFADVARRLRGPLPGLPHRVISQRLSVWGGALAHAGLGVTVLGLAAMAFAQHTIVAVTPGTTTEFAGLSWTLDGIIDLPGPNYEARKARITVTRDGQPIAVLTPGRRNYPVQGTKTSDVAIRTNGLRDLYAVLGEEEGGRAVLRLHDNPGAPEIWFGALIMATGGLASLLDRRLRLGVAVRERRSSMVAAE